ncbi:MAG: acetyl-CoA carboxylase biotin carboxyl carrier protein subunit [Deltaproteobacteria bacterium]|nr:acetyl-CoA carboxylase biotin carboxyl carrier protein subunit [Deltaproteobacteria bacterium]MBW2414606.1 acetyl-CoA carboxylase biotin carboxyl carrier protein subunit [Deltaproteobacteria bacterium]
MRYRIQHGPDTFHVDVHEVGAHLYDVTIDDGETVRVDAYKTPRTVYSVLVGNRQLEGSVDPREDGTLDVHVGTSAFDFTAIDERRELLVGSTGGTATGRQEIRVQMPGKIVKVMVSEGQEVALDDGLVVIEAMKMENEIKSPIDGVVTAVEVSEGDAVDTDALLIVVEPHPDEA